MMRRNLALLVALILVFVIAGTTIYLTNETINQPKNPSIHTQISRLNKQLTSLTEELKNLTSANLVTSLNIHEMSGANSSYMEGLVKTSSPIQLLVD